MPQQIITNDLCHQLIVLARACLQAEEKSFHST
jgi:hypothetical protein